MARIIVLDSGVLGLATRRPGQTEVDAFHEWWIQADAGGILFAIPAIVDYEVRRGLILSGSISGIRRLDNLLGEWPIIPVTNDALKLAARLWADVNRRGLPVDDARTLGADSIIAAQAISYTGPRDRLTIATTNARHLARFPVTAAPWQDIPR